MNIKTLSKIIASSLLAINSLSVSISSHAQTEKPQAIDSVNLQQYIGKWYEIAHLPMYFQRNCASKTTAQYAINSDKTVSVLNSCRTIDNKLISSEGIAYAQNAGNSKLQVSFLPKGLRWLPFTKGDYWVLRIDPEYKAVLIGGPTNKYLWILSRTPTIDDATYNSYLETAKKYGYDVNKLVKTPQ